MRIPHPRLIIVTVLIAAVACGAVGLVIWYPFSYVPYVPIRCVWDRGTPRLVDDPGALTAEHEVLIIEVFESYHVPHDIDDGRIMIRRSLAWDRDLLWNCSQKAGVEPVVPP